MPYLFGHLLLDLLRGEATPFPHQGPLPPPQVHGREDLLAEVTAKVTARQVTALLGPRRFGRASVLVRLAEELSEIADRRVDPAGVGSIIDVAGRVHTAVRGGTRGRRRGCNSFEAPCDGSGLLDNRQCLRCSPRGQLIPSSDERLPITSPVQVHREVVGSACQRRPWSPTWRCACAMLSAVCTSSPARSA